MKNPMRGNHWRVGTVVATGVVLGALAAGCASDDDAESTMTTTVAAATSQGSAATTTAAATTTSSAGAAFDPETVPLSDADLGEFPYFSIPAGFENPNKDIPDVPRDQVPVWTGQRFEMIIGKVHRSLIHVVDDATFSQFALLEAIEKQITEVGGEKIAEGKIPTELVEELGDDVRQANLDGLSHLYSGKSTTFLVRQSDRRVWIQVTSDTAGASWMITEEKVDPAETE